MNTDHTDKRSVSALSRVLLLLMLIVLVLTACSRSPQSIATTVVTTPGLDPTSIPTVRPTLTPTPPYTPSPTATPAGWETIAEGVHIRRMIGFENERRGMVFALRLDPARVDVKMRYDPQRPLRVAGWFRAEQPIAALNAGFFDRDNTPVGLWVIDGITYGKGHFRMQGEFRVTGAGVSIRRVNERYLSDGTRTLVSLESYPLLIMPGRFTDPCLGRGAQFNRFGEWCVLSALPAERMVVGVDGAGFLVFLLAPSKTFTLSGLAGWLRQSDLNLDVGLNLDGGSSAGMLVQTGAGVWGEDSGREVPGALIIMPKPLGLEGSEPP